MHESNTPIFTGFVDVFFNCMLPRIIPTNDETNGNKIIIAATQINFQPFSTIPNKPLCARIGITGNIKYTPCQGQIKKKGFNFPASRWLYHYISLPSSLSISDKGIFPLIGYIPVVIY